MTAITDGGDLQQMNMFLSQRKLNAQIDLIETKGPVHCPQFTMRLSVRDQNSKH